MDVRELIMQRLKLADITLTDASISIGRNASYLQQFVKRGVPVELRERERTRLAQLLGVHADELRDKSAPLPALSPDAASPFPMMATALANHHLRSAPASRDASSSRQNWLDNVRPHTVMLRDLPVYGTAANSGGNDSGAFVVSDDPVDYEARPDFLAHNRGAYALIVLGDEMDPECKHGSRAIVDPNLPARNGDTCVFRSRNEPGVPTTARVNVLVKSNERTWTVRQHSPKREFELKKSDYPDCHTVVGNYYRR